MNIYTWVSKDRLICFGDMPGVPDVFGGPGRWFYWSRGSKPVKDLQRALRGAYGYPWGTPPIGPRGVVW